MKNNNDNGVVDSDPLIALSIKSSFNVADAFQLKLCDNSRTHAIMAKW